MSEKNYYETLGIQKGVGKDEIKKAFRKLAAQYHPDKKTGDEAKFKEISEAYSVLSDDKKRAEYDAYGHSFAGGGGQGQPGGGAGFGGFDFSGFQNAGGDFSFDINDIFENFGFGGGGARAARGRDISIDINIPFKDSIFGTKRSVLITKTSACNDCSGTGAKGGSELITCTNCNGQGKVRETRQSIMGTFQTVAACSTCHGSGKVPKEKCTQCAGAGVRKQEEEIEIAVPAGVQNGEVVRMTGRGEAVPHGQAGDLYIKLHVEKGTGITREGQNLISSLAIKLTDALLGAKYTVETLDGPVTITIPEGIKHGELLRIKGKGVPNANSSGRGDFLVKVNIAMPQKLSKSAQKLVEELRNEGI